MKTKLFASWIIVGLLTISAEPALAADVTSSLYVGSTTTPAAATTTLGIDVSTTISTVTTSSTRELIDEPTIRVGLYKTADPVLVQVSDEYTVYNGPDAAGTLSANGTVKLSYSAGVYHVESDGVSFDTPHAIRLVPAHEDAFFTITNYSRKMPGRPGNYNAYRGTLEYRYSDRSSAPYLIEELPMEQYLRGLAEASDSNPPEYLSALVIAARSYAFSALHPVSPNHLFDVFATTADQLYLGYNSEITMPHTVAAVEATTGEMVTYDGQPVETPYFGHSNGKTKSWVSKSKANARPWLKSVKATYDKGMRYWGHGYGMSTHDALMRATKDGWEAPKILSYYYSDTAVERIY